MLTKKLLSMKKVLIILSLMIVLVACGSDEPATGKEDTPEVSLVGLWMLDGQKATLTFYNNGVLDYNNPRTRERGSCNYSYSKGKLIARGYEGTAIISTRADGVYLLTISGLNDPGDSKYEGVSNAPCINGTWVRQ